MVESVCHNKVCVDTGWIENPGQLIVCLPNRVYIEIQGANKDDLDAIVC